VARVHGAITAQRATVSLKQSLGERIRAISFLDAVVAAAILAGIGMRIWIFSSPLAAIDSDEAIVGLMARHALHGDVSVFYWGALYGGSQEAFLVAAVFAVAGSSVIALKLVSVAIYAVAAVLVWRVGRRTVGEPAAGIGAGLFWVWPPFLVWWSTKERAYFGSGIVIGLVAILLALRLRERESRLDAAALGFTLGLGLWATLQSWLLAVPAVVWLVWRRPSVLRLARLALPAALVGASPWLAWNVHHGWNAVLPTSVAGAGSTYFGRLWDLFAVVLPTWLGLRVPYSHDWFVWPPLGIALLLLALGGFALLLVRRPRGLEPLLVLGVGFAILYAASSFTYFTAEPRYLTFLAPVPALLLGRALVRPPLAMAALAGATALSIAGLVRMERDGLFSPRASEGGLPADFSPLIGFLERQGVRHVLANYWIAYRLSFESRERVIATSTGQVRYEPHDRLVRADRAPTYVFLTRSADERRLSGGLEGRGYHLDRVGRFDVYLPPPP
jgi:Dolichyl-phosphate-mannose-protein mannosyltransferase